MERKISFTTISRNLLPCTPHSLRWVFKLSRLTIKPTKWYVRPTKPQISLGIRPVWSESSLSVWWKVGPLATHWAHSEDSDQTGRMFRLMWVFAGRKANFVRFVMRWLNYYKNLCHPQNKKDSITEGVISVPFLINHARRWSSGPWRAEKLASWQLGNMNTVKLAAWPYGWMNW